MLESRQERNNQLDRRVISAAQRAGKASTELRYEFGIPEHDPLLWTADAVASVVLGAESGRSASMLATIGHAVRRINL